MRLRSLITSALGVALATPGPVADPAPDFNASRWYNTPPLTADDFQGKAILVEVFRTW